MTNHGPFKLLLSLGLLALPSFSWAKKEKPVFTPTATSTSTSTAVPTETPSVYTGKKFYTFDAKWGSKGTAADRLDSPTDIDITSDGKLLIADTGNNRVLIWDSEGRPSKAYGSFGTSAVWRNSPQFNLPSAVLSDSSKKMYVADTLNQRIVVLDEQGLVISTWGTPGKDKGQFNFPQALARDSQGNIWVVDTDNSRVQIFSGLGLFISAWGTLGTEPGLLNKPVGVVLNNIDQPILTDRGNFRIQVFNDKGAPVTTQGWFGEGPSQFKEPDGLTITKTGMIAVTDGILGRVVFFNSRFEFAGQWTAKDDILGGYDSPHFHGIACDSQNRLYLTDQRNHCVVRLKPLETHEAPAAIKPTPTPEANDPYGGMGFPIR